MRFIHYVSIFYLLILCHTPLVSSDKEDNGEYSGWHFINSTNANIFDDYIPQEEEEEQTNGKPLDLASELDDFVIMSEEEQEEEIITIVNNQGEIDLKNLITSNYFQTKGLEKHQALSTPSNDKEIESNRETEERSSQLSHTTVDTPDAITKFPITGSQELDDRQSTLSESSFPQNMQAITKENHNKNEERNNDAHQGVEDSPLQLSHTTIDIPDAIAESSVTDSQALDEEQSISEETIPSENTQVVPYVHPEYYIRQYMLRKSQPFAAVGGMFFSSVRKNGLGIYTRSPFNRINVLGQG